MLTPKSCPLCESREFQKLYTIKKYKRSFEIVRCNSCKLIFQNPECWGELKDLYDKEYFEGTADFSYTRDSSIDLPIWEERVKTLERFLGKKSSGRRLLDVGCGQGDLLKAGEIRGWEAIGIDISSYAVKKAQGRGLNVKEKQLNDAEFPEKCFDVITMFEVIEHIPNPREVLDNAYKFLRDSGLLVIQTANIDSLRGNLRKENYYYFEPGHLVYYSFTTIKKLLEVSMFKIQKYWFGSELSLISELKTLRNYYPWHYLIFKKPFERIKIRNISINTVMVIWAVKK